MSINLVPPKAPLPPPPQHGVLKGVIRCTGGALALGSILGVVMVSFGLYKAVRGVTEHGYSWTGALILAAVDIVLLVAVKVGFDMFRPVNQASVANFSFLIALGLGAAAYYPLEYVFLRVVAYLMMGHAASIPMDPVTFNRFLTSLALFITFFLFYKWLNYRMLRHLGLNAGGMK